MPTKKQRTKKRPPVIAEGECCCAECGSLRVEYAVWYDPNTGTARDVFGSWNAGDNTFCVDCDINGRDCNAPLVDKGADPKAFKIARAKWAKHEGVSPS